tara:strand:+ start:4817 stop:5023 length:207 start_codon:yes stop_codon:yes gene_type:complete
MSDTLCDNLFTGKYLRVIENTLTLPAGIIVYCFLDFGEEFRVHTSNDYHGVREFIFTDSSRNKFTEYL